MKPFTKVLLTLAMAMLFVGGIACAASYIISNKNLSSLGIDTTYYLTEYVYGADEKEDAKEPEKINLIVDKHHVVVRQSANAEDKLTVSYAENQYDTFTIAQISNELYFTNEDPRNMFFRFFCLLFDSKKEKEALNTVYVTLPMDYEGKLNIVCTDADVQLYGVEHLSEIKLDTKNADVTFEYSSATDADLKVKNGNLTLASSVFDDLAINISNKAVFVPVEEPDETLNPDESPLPEETLLPEETPEPTPEATVSPEETLSPETTLAPDATPLPETTVAPTPKPTETPKVLLVQNEVKFANADFKHLTLTASYTNITGNISRNILYYNITTNNTDSSNISNYENKSTQGSIVISQTGGSTAVYFK